MANCMEEEVIKVKEEKIIEIKHIKDLENLVGKEQTVKLFIEHYIKEMGYKILTELELEEIIEEE